MSDYWLSDAESRVLGPIGFSVLEDLAAAGKLKNVRAVSKDGVNFSPVSDFPEVTAALAPRTATQIREQQLQMVDKVRAYLADLKRSSPHDAFRVQKDASLEIYRAAFFTVLKRFYPDRLPPTAPQELRRACEDVFLYLCALMLSVEQRLGGQFVNLAAPIELARLNWRSGIVETQLELGRGRLAALTLHPDCNYQKDGVYLVSDQRVPLGTSVVVTMMFDGAASPMRRHGRVVVENPGGMNGLPPGFGVKIDDLVEHDRNFIRSYVARSGQT